jgi:ribosomal protein S14
MKNCFFKIFKELNKKKKNELNDLIVKIIILKRKKKDFYISSNFLLRKKNICIETGCNRSVYNEFYLSRCNIRKNLKLGGINGLKKIS